MKKILITGGAGFVGSNTAMQFSKKGWSVHLMDNLSRKGTKHNLTNLKKNIKFKFYKIDVSNFNSTANLIKKLKPTLLIHCAGQVAVTTSVLNPRNDLNTNIIGIFNILESIRLYSKKTKLINMSTNKVYGNIFEKKITEHKKRYDFLGKAKSVDENCPLDFYSPYGCSKGSADQYVRDYSRIYGLDTIVLRMSCIYGNMQFGIEDHGWVTWMTILAYFEKTIKIFGDGKQVRDLLFIDDLVKLFLKLSKTKKDINKIYNVGGGNKNSLSIIELLELLEKKINKKIKYKKFNWRLGDQKIYISNNTKIKKEHSWSPNVRTSEGLDRVIKWVNKNENEIKKILNI